MKTAGNTVSETVPFPVQDPDGYLLRISQDLGTRPHRDAQ